MGSLRTIGQGLRFDTETLNLGIGSAFTPNVRLTIFNNNPQSWKTAIFKNTDSSDYLSIGTYNNNTYLSVISNDNSSFKNLYLNNIGDPAQPSSTIGNVIINGKTTIGNYTNNTTFNHSLDVVSKTNDIAIFRNNNVQLSLAEVSSKITLNTNNNNIGIIPNTYISSNLFVNGIITGSGDNISNLSNLNLKNIVNPSYSKLPTNWLNIKENNPIKSSTDTNQLYLDYDESSSLYLTPSGKLSINLGLITVTAASIANFWNSNVTPSIIYFKNGDSFVGIGNTNPKSQLWIGDNGNLFRLTTPTALNLSYYTQISTNDNTNNNTNIRLITPTPLNTISGTDLSLSAGSIYYSVAGDNPSHIFIYEKDGIKTNLMNINKSGNVIVQSSLTVGNNVQLSPTDTDKMRVYGNISVNNSNNIPCKVTIGDTNTNNSILNTFGKIIIGNSNNEASDYSLYVNNNSKFNNKVVIGTTLTSYDGLPLITDYPLNVYGNIGITGNIFTTSDEREKTNIKTINNSLDKICQCRGVSFNYLNDINKNQYGVIAQEIEKIIPDIVESNQYGYKNVNYLSIIGFLIEAIKELNNKINNSI